MIDIPGKESLPNREKSMRHENYLRNIFRVSIKQILAT
jgi:hypothetical protein